MVLVKILVTGSRGVIGRVLTRSLSDSFDVYGIDIKAEEDGRNFRADISCFEEVDSIFKKIGAIECVVHLAGDPRVDASWESVLKNNIIGTRNVYECSRGNGVKKVIFASSCHVVGGYEGFPFSLCGQTNKREIAVDDPLRPDSHYGTSKAFGEAIARQYFELYGIRSICLRIGWVLESDDPTRNERLMRIWLSHRDLVQLVTESIVSSIRFGVYYGISNNKGRFLDIRNAQTELGYQPQDDSSLMK